MVKIKSSPPAAPAPAQPQPLALIFGEDEYSVKRRARELFDLWCAENPQSESEIIDASVANAGEALRAIARLREALQTLPFFGGQKVVWFRNCNFVGDERTAETQAVTSEMAALGEELAGFKWDNVRLLISAGKVDRRRAFFRKLEKFQVESLAGWTAEDRHWEEKARNWVRAEIRELRKEISEDALGRFVAAVGPNARQLGMEAEKLALFTGARNRIGVDDVKAIVTHQKRARAFALAEALGERDLSQMLRAFTEEISSLKTETQKSELGILYGLISKVRSLIFAKELIRRGWLKPESDFGRFRLQLQRIPRDGLPTEARANPLALAEYVLFRGAQQAGRYQSSELVRALELLLKCNQRLVGSSLDPALVLQQTLVQIVQPAGGRPGTP